MNTTAYNSYFSILLRSIETEFLKLKSSKIWLAILAIPILAVLIGAGNFTVNHQALTGNTWFDFWTQVALFYGYFFYPLLMALLAAYLFRLEHTGNNWNLEYSYPFPLSIIWFSKLIVLFCFAVLTQLICLLAYFLIGFLILHLTDPIPPYYIWWFIGGSTCIMAVGAMQLFLSLVIKSFSVPIGIAFISTFLGLACYSKGIWFYPNTLAIIGINAQHEAFPSLLEIGECYSGVLFWVIFFSVLAITYLQKRKVFR